MAKDRRGKDVFTRVEWRSGISEMQQRDMAGY